MGQAFNVTVPFSGTSLTMGTAVGGAGVSLITGGQALVDAAGSLSLQSKGAFNAQTNAAMAWLSTSGNAMHCGAGIKINAGGGTGPGACGAGGPAGTVSHPAPAAAAEAQVTQATAVTALTKNLYDYQNASNTAGQVKAAIDAAKNTSSAIGTNDHIQHNKTAKDGFSYGGSALEAAAGVASYMGATDASGKASGVGGVYGAIMNAGAKLFGAADLEERAAGSIIMCSDQRILANCGDSVDFKTSNQFKVMAGLQINFATTVFGNFAVAKWESKAGGLFKLNCKTAEIKGKLTGEFKALKVNLSAVGTFTGKAPKIEVARYLTVTKDTHLQKTLTVAKATKLFGEFEMANEGSKVVMENDLEVAKASHFHKELEIEGTLTMRAKCTVKKKCNVRGKLEITDSLIAGV